MKLVLIGLWLTLVALGSTYAAALYMSDRTGAAQAPASALQQEKTRVLNVPMIAGGKVQGFMSVQFVYTIDGAALKALTVPPEIYLLDEAFRTIYTDPTLDFNHLEKYDLAKLTNHLLASTNTHLGAPLIKEVLIADLSYVPKDTTVK